MSGFPDCQSFSGRRVSYRSLPRPEPKEIPGLVSAVDHWGDINVKYPTIRYPRRGEGQRYLDSVEYIGNARGFTVFLQFDPRNKTYKLKLSDIFADDMDVHECHDGGSGLSIGDLYTAVQDNYRKKRGEFHNAIGNLAEAKR